MEDVYREAVIGHEPDESPARVVPLPKEDHKAQADPQAEEGLPEGVGSARPIEAASDRRDAAVRPDPEDEDPKPEDRPDDEDGLEPFHPEGIRDPEKPAPPAGDDPDGEEGDVGGEVAELHVHDVCADRLDEADEEGCACDDEPELDDVPMAWKLSLLLGDLLVREKKLGRGVDGGEDQKGQGKPHRPRAAEEFQAEDVIEEIPPHRGTGRSPAEGQNVVIDGRIDEEHV